MRASSLLDKLDEIDSYKRFGRVKQVVGLMIESQGPESSIGDLCLIHVNHRRKRVIQAEVVGFRDENVILMPYTSVNDIAPGSLVEATLKPLEIKVGPALIGSVVDALGDSLDVISKIATKNKRRLENTRNHSFLWTFLATFFKETS